MARNLAQKGFALRVFDACQERAESAFPAQLIATSLRQLAHECQRLIFCLPNCDVLQRVLFGAGVDSSHDGDGQEDVDQHGLAAFLKPGQVVIDCGTSHPEWTRKTERSLRERGIVFLDAPVSGMAARADAGTLAIMVGGDRATFDEVKPALLAMGKEVTYLGEAGSGQLTKMLNNVLFNVSIAAMAEVLPIAVRLGLDPQQFAQVVSHGSGQSFGFDSFAPLVMKRSFEAGRGGYPLASAFKDMQAVDDVVCGRLGLAELPSVVSGTMSTYKEALSKGYGAEHKGAMIKVWEERLGAQVSAPGRPHDAAGREGEMPLAPHHPSRQ